MLRNTSILELLPISTSKFIFRTMNNKKQALNDFNICVNLDEKFSKVYL